MENDLSAALLLFFPFSVSNFSAFLLAEAKVYF